MKTALLNFKRAAILAGALLAGTAGLNAQNTNRRLHLKPEKRITVKKELDAFTGIEASSAFKIQVTQSDRQSVSLDAPENYLPYLRLEVKNGTLRIDVTDTVDVSFEDMMCMVTISVKQLDRIKLSGASMLSSSGTITADKFSCRLSGASAVDLSLNSSAFTCYVSGASAANVKGKVNGVADLDISGASVMHGYNLQTRSADCNVSGASKAELYAEEALRIEASGVSQVNYKGKAKVTAMASGMSSVSAK